MLRRRARSCGEERHREKCFALVRGAMQPCDGASSRLSNCARESPFVRESAHSWEGRRTRATYRAFVRDIAHLCEEEGFSYKQEGVCARGSENCGNFPHFSDRLKCTSIY